MSDYEVNIRVGRPAPRRRGGGRRPKCTFDCAFCKGTGKDPSSIISTEPCKVCSGVGKITLTVSCNNLVKCSYCKGSGRDPSSIVSLQPCPVCKGHGKKEIGTNA